MQSSLTSLPAFLPLSPTEEEIRLLQPLTSIQIKNDLDKAEILKNGVLLLTTKKAIWYNENRGFYFFYQNAISHGYQGLNLICMINFANENEEENFKGVCMNEEVGQEGGEDGEEEEDYVFEKIKSSAIPSSSSDFIQIIGEYTVTIDFSLCSLPDLTEVFRVFSECSSLNPDENAADCGLFGLDPEELITGEDIDENGNVIEQKEEEEDEDDDEEKEEEEEGGMELE